jgi:hypothetical protein
MRGRGRGREGNLVEEGWREKRRDGGMGEPVGEGWEGGGFKTTGGRQGESSMVSLSFFWSAVGCVT